MIQPVAVALMYEAYVLVGSRTDPYYALHLIRMLADNMDDVRNIIQSHESVPFETPTQ